MENRGGRHVEDAALLAALDGELAADERAAVEAHLSACAECARRGEELRFTVRRVAAALEELDAPGPWADMPPALREAAAASPAPIRSREPGTERSGTKVGRRAIAAAAGLTLLLAAGAYAVPGSPVRGWVDDSIGAIATLIGVEEAGPEEAGPTTVSVEPVDGAVRVAVLGATSSLRIRISLSDGEEASVTARQAAFHVESGTIGVTDPAGELTIALPRAARTATVEVDGTVVARLEAGQLTRQPAADDVPAEILLTARG